MIKKTTPVKKVSMLTNLNNGINRLDTINKLCSFNNNKSPEIGQNKIFIVLIR
jgi:hypothetical protein